MTTETYLVAYPNSLIVPGKRICTVKVSPLTCGDDVISQLRVRYPSYTEDFGDVTLYKVSRCLSMANPCVQSLFQAVNIKLKDLRTEPMQAVRDWFRDKTEDDELSWAERIVTLFPDGPYNPLDDLVDIVVVTLDGTS